MTEFSGRCLCGAVRYEVNGPLGDPHACHCSQCRRQSGHYVAATSAKRSDFVLTEKRGLKWYRSSDTARRGFCGECGSVLFWDDGGAEISINAGSLDQPTGLARTSHTVVGVTEANLPTGQEKTAERIGNTVKGFDAACRQRRPALRVAPGGYEKFGLKLTSHIFVDEKADYYDIADELPKYSGYDTPLQSD